MSGPSPSLLFFVKVRTWEWAIMCMSQILSIYRSPTGSGQTQSQYSKCICSMVDGICKVVLLRSQLKKNHLAVV